MTSKHGLTPIEYKVLIKPVEAAKKIGNIHLADETVERDQHAATEGEVIAVSPMAFTYETWPTGSREPEVGDQVVFARYAGMKIRGNDGVEYWLVNDKDITCIRDRAADVEAAA